MKIRLSIDFDSVAEYEAFRQHTSIEEVKAKATKDVQVEVKAPTIEKKLKAPKTNESEPSFEPVTPEDDCPFTPHTQSELKVLLSEKLKSGKKMEVKAFLNSHGATGLSELLAKDGVDINAVYAEAEAI